jgi:ABC-type glycerol-3-phosphate transport system substrate-binding protein
MILGPSAIAGIPQFTEGMEITLIPGGTPVISVDGLAISAGTQNPEAAYEFIKFLTESPELLENAFGSIPARRSLADVDISDDQAVFGIEELSPEAEAVVQEALALALNPADFRFSELIADAADVMVAESIDASTALEQVEQETLQDLAAADARRGVDEVIVVGPTPVPELAPGQNSIRFAISSFISPLPTQDVWEQTIADFVADNPDVGNVTLEVEQNFGNVEPEDLAAQFDCFYLPNNVVRSIDLDTILALDPLLSTDPNFNRDDLVGQVFAEVQRENQTWALPLTLQPEVLFYNRDIFVENGVPLPEGGWTVPQFEEALRSIKVTQDDPSPFVPQNLGNSYLLVLIASYGGLPVDYRTTPVTLDFTSPEVVDAAREVLDLAKAGYIAYEPSVEGGLQFFGGGGDDDPVAIYNQLLNPLISLIGGGGDENEANQLVTFPQGNQLNAVSYDLGAAYISATTDNVETCYRFISTIATTPGLFTDMPAFRSQIDAPETVQEQGEDAVAFYRAMDELLQQPSTVLIPTPITGALENTGNAIAQLWLNRAFDRYVLGDADLEAELQEAQQFANEFLDCIGGVEPADIGGEEFNAFIQEVLDCIGDVDPTLRDQLGI